MRDIRGDLQDRVSFLEEQIITAEAQFDKHVGQLRHEHEIRVEDLKDELQAVTTLIEVELRRLTSSAPAQDEPRRPAPEVEQERRPAPESDGHFRTMVSDAEPYRRPAPEADRHDRRPVAAEVEQQRRPTVEAEPYRRPVAVAAEQERRPAVEAEPYRRPVAAEAERQHRPAPQAEPHRRPVEREAEPRRRPAPVATAEVEHDRRPAAPQIYRRPPPTASAPETEQRRPVAKASQSLADFLLRKLGEIGAMTLDDLCQHAAQEGCFNDGEITDRGVHITLMNVVKAGFIRQLPNGTFAPATVMDTIRLRRAI